MTTHPAPASPERHAKRRAAHPQRMEILAILADARMRIDRINAPVAR